MIPPGAISTIILPGATCSAARNARATSVCVNEADRRLMCRPQNADPSLFSAAAGRNRSILDTDSHDSVLFNPIDLTFNAKTPKSCAMAYQRGQVLLALWAARAGHLGLPTSSPLTWTPLSSVKALPKTFVRRAGNLLDRGVGITDDRRAGQHGIFQEYEIEDVVELGIGLSLLNAGVPQSETVKFILRFRKEIRDYIAAMPRSTVDSSFPHLLIVEPLAWNETLRLFDKQPELRSDKYLSFYAPEFVSNEGGWVALAKKKLGHRSSERIVIEIGDLVSFLNDELSKTESAPRGRR